MNNEINIENIIEKIIAWSKKIFERRFLSPKTKNLSQVCKKFLMRGGEQRSRTPSRLLRDRLSIKQRRIRCALLSELIRRRFIITKKEHKTKTPSRICEDVFAGSILTEWSFAV